MPHALFTRVYVAPSATLKSVESSNLFKYLNYVSLCETVAHTVGRGEFWCSTQTDTPPNLSHSQLLELLNIY